MKRLLLAAAALFAAPAHAQDEAAPAAQAPAKVKVPEHEAAEPSTAGMGGSEANRQGKIAYVGAEAGLGLVFPAQGIEAGYFLTPDLTLSASYIASGFSLFGVTVDMNLFTARANYFFGNSFYAGLGLGQRSIAFKFNIDGVDSTGTVTQKDAYKLSSKVTSFGADLGIGNRWQWDGFWLGVEWVGYFAPLSSSGATKLNTPAGASAQDTKDSQKALDQLGKQGNGQLLRLALGWAF